MLIDTGNGGAAAARDADRIMAAVKDAGLTRIDHLITTHWHGDHFGGMAELAGRIPIRQFIDHGPNVQPAAAADDFLQKVYPTLYQKATHTVAKPGDTIAVAGLDWRIVSAAGADAQDRAARSGQAEPVLCRATSRRIPIPPKTRNRSAASSPSAIPRRAPRRPDRGTRNST